MKKLLLIFAMIFTLGFSFVFAEPNYSFYLTCRDEMSHKRYWATIARNGEKWSLRLPLADFEAKNLASPQFSETDEGFSLFFSWGGGRWLQQDTFFFRDEEDEPVLYKVLSNTDEYGRTKDGDFDLVDQYTEFSEINPPIKISRLGTNKILNLFSGGYKRLPKVTCADSDYDKPIKDKIMHLEVRKEGNLIQNLEYVYGENPHGLFGIGERFEPKSIGISKKHFELVDLNFDGYDDILIFAGCTENEHQYYDAYLWNKREERYDFNPPCWEGICPADVKCNEIDRVLYTRGLTGNFSHYIYEYDEENEKYIKTGSLYYNSVLHLYSENGKYSDAFTDWDLKDPTVIPYEKLPERWKRALIFAGCTGEDKGE